MRRTWTLLALLALLGVVAWLLWSAAGRGHVPARLGSAAGAAPPAETDPARLPDAASPEAPTHERVVPQTREDGPSGAERAPPPTPTPLRARLLDERTGEPVPDLALEVFRNEEESGEALVTDAEGRFATRTQHQAGSFRFAWHEPSRADSDYEDVELSLDTLAEVVELRLGVGPTYVIDVAAPPGLALERLGARISTQPERRWARQSPPTALRPGTPSSFRLPWVRFPPERVFGAHSHGPWMLEVTSDDGLWQGVAQVDSIVGRHPALVTLALTERASLRGTVHDEQGNPVAKAWMRLVRREDGQRLEQWFLPAGLFQADALEPGHWTLEIESYEHATERTELVLATGEQVVLEVVLRALDPAGGVSGWAISTSGAWAGEIALWGHAGSKSNRRVPLDWKVEGARRVSRFAFEDVPAGTYELELVARDCPFEVLPAPKQLVTVPAHDLELVVRDDVPTAALRFRVRDAATGSELSAHDVWWRPGGGWSSWRRDQPSGATLVEAWPVGRAFTWVVRAAGHALVSGDEHDLVREGEALVADVTLPLGWGAQFFLRDARGRALEGIRLTFDGVPSAPSDADGRLPVALPARPRAIGVATPGLGITGGDVDPLGADLEEDRWWAVGVVLE